MTTQEKRKQKVSFSLTGEYLTNLARDQVLSKNWEFSMRFLKEDLLKDDGEPALTYDQIIQILKGDMKLVGESNNKTQTMNIAKDDDEKYKKDLNYIYSAIYNDGNGHFYQPYAKVTSWGKEDLTNNVKRKNMNKEGNPVLRLFKQRTFWHDSLHYSDNTETDICLIQRFDSILFKEIDPPPLWIKTYKNIKKAYDNLDSRIKLEERGWLKKYGNDPKYNEEPLELRIHKRAKKRSSQKEIPKAKKDNIKTYRKEILDQNKNQWIEIEVPDICEKSYSAVKNGTLKVPKAPFEQWALWRTSGSHIATEWTTISPQSLRPGSDPRHTDWMIGADLPLDAFQEPEETAKILKDAVFDKMYQLQKDLLGFECTVLSGHRMVQGTVVYPDKGQKVEKDEIAIIPSAHPDYLDTVLSAAGTITERGGKLCHLALVGKEQSACLVQKDKARQLYPEGTILTIFPASGKIEISTREIRGLL